MRAHDQQNLIQRGRCKMIKVLSVDNLSQETYTANILIKCSNPPQGENWRIRASN